MSFKIGIFGSAVHETREISHLATQLGQVLADEDVILITGACSGLPYEVVSAAFKKNPLEIWGFSPAKDFESQVALTPDDDNHIYSRLIYTPSNFEFVKDDSVTKKYRNVISTATCEAGILLSGRWGTLNEFTNLFDMGKVIGVLKSSGGISQLLPEIFDKINKPSKAKVFFESSPEVLVKKVIDELKRRQSLP